MTLPKASERLGHPAGYFTIRRSRFRNHTEFPFPQPVTEVGGIEVFDLQTLVVWDEDRKARDREKREAWEQNREPKEA